MPTVLHRLSRWADADPKAVAQRYKQNNTWHPITAREFRDRVHFLAAYLESRGVTREHAGAVFAYNSPEWVHTDLALLLVGAKSAGIYPNANSKDIHYILNHTQSRVLAVQNGEYLKKITDGGQLPGFVELVLVFEETPSTPASSLSPKAISIASAIAHGRELVQSGKAPRIDQYLSKINPNEGAFLIYTSGTTGNPKGALLSHDNLTFTSDIASRWWKLPFGHGSLFSFLPLCHIAEKLQNVGVGLSQRYTVSFCTKFENVASELVEVQPTLLLCVPRLWEKMMDGVLNKVRASEGVKKKLAQWALATGARVADAKYSGRWVSPLDLLQLKLADRLVLAKVRHAMGLGKAEMLASGAAALAPHISKWFRSLRLEILEDFGQTESTGVICMTESGVESAGTVGKPVTGVEFKLAEDGEILTKGRHVFVGYFKDPEATASTLVNGWLQTGDLGEINEHGLVRIKGRKKEVLKTSGGKMVAPLPIEERLKAAPPISQVCIVGDGRKYLSALITLSETRLGELKAQKPTVLDGAVISDPEVLAEIKGYVSELNRELASFEQIKQYTVLSREFSIVDGEMTPTLKMKRNVIESRFRELIDRMYPAGAADRG